jgi:hypothetical protein
MWNITGLILLANIVTIAILSFPTPFRAYTDPPGSDIIASFPFIWLPGILVPVAYSMHFLSLVQLIRRQRSGDVEPTPALSI